MSKKNLVIITAAVALISYLFLPYVSISMFGQTYSVSFIKLLTEGGAVSFFDILPIFTAIAIVVAGIKGIKKLAVGCSIASVVVMIATIGGAAEKFASAGIGFSVFDVLGIGYWIAMVAFIASTVFSFKMED